MTFDRWFFGSVRAVLWVAAVVYDVSDAKRRMLRRWEVPRL